MFGKIPYLLMALTAVLGPAPAAWSEEVEPEIEYEYYDVTPEEGRSLSMSLFSASPIFHEGKNYAGLTKSYFSYRYDTAETLMDVCRLQNMEVKSRCVITLPRLTNGDPDLTQAFNNYLDRLRAHELEHCRITTYYAGQFKKHVSKMDDMKCSKLVGEVRAEYDRANDELNREQVNYDQRTVHGKYEGADINEHLNEMNRNKSVGSPSPQTHVSGGGLRNLDSNMGQSGIYKDKNGVWRNY